MFTSIIKERKGEFLLSREGTFLKKTPLEVGRGERMARLYIKKEEDRKRHFTALKKERKMFTAQTKEKKKKGWGLPEKIPALASNHRKGRVRRPSRVEGEKRKRPHSYPSDKVD